MPGIEISSTMTSGLKAPTAASAAGPSFTAPTISHSLRQSRGRALENHVAVVDEKDTWMVDCRHTALLTFMFTISKAVRGP